MINKKMQEGFTILEMMIVLSIVALLFLLTLPNIQQKEEIIEEKGCEALTAVVDAQIRAADRRRISERITETMSGRPLHRHR